MNNDRLMGRYAFIAYVLSLLIQLNGCHGTRTASLPISASDHSQPHGFRFIIAADPQLMRGKKEDLDIAIKSIHDFKPEFVIMCGDLIETPANLHQIKAYKDAVSKLSDEIVLVNVSGNHDLGQPVKKDNIDAYKMNFGDLWFHFTYENSLFIVLSSDILKDPGAPLHEQQTEWLIRFLEDAHTQTFDNIFVFMHHPLYLNSPNEPDGYSNMPIKSRQSLLSLFLKHRVRAVFSGHLHDNRINSYQGMDLITTNSITVPMGKTPAGFRVVEVNQDGYNDNYYTIEQLAKKEVNR